MLEHLCRPWGREPERLVLSSREGVSSAPDWDFNPWRRNVATIGSTRQSGGPCRERVGQTQFNERLPIDTDALRLAVYGVQ